MSSKKKAIKGLSKHPILQPGTERTYYVSWTGVKGVAASHIDHYEVVWSYRTGKKGTATGSPWFNESASSVKTKTSTYNAPNNALEIRVKVRGVSKTYKENKQSKTYFTGKFSGWKKTSVSSKTATVYGTVDYTGDDLTISSVNGSVSNVKATWNWPVMPVLYRRERISEDRLLAVAAHVDGYEYEWEYSVDQEAIDRDWLEGTSGTTSAKAITYSVPADATYIRIHIRPFAEANSIGVPYWEANWGDWEILKVSSLRPSVPKKKAISSVSLGIQKGTTDTLYASWSWGVKNTDHYEFTWQYYTGDNDENGKIWYEGTDGTSNVKNTTYQMPANATKVRFRVKPIAKTHTVGGTEYDYWTAPNSKYHTITKKETTPTIPSVDPIDEIRISGIEGTSNLRAVWTWNEDNTKEYQYEWQYADRIKNPIWYEPTTGTATVKNATYSVPNNAVQVRFRVRAIAKTKTASGQEIEYWTSPKSDYETFTLSSLAPSVPYYDPIDDLTVDLQDGTARTLYCLWSWPYKNVDYFAVKWVYYTGDRDANGNKIWFYASDTPEQVSPQTRNQSTYQVPDNAIEAAVQVKPFALTHTVAGTDYEYWRTKYSPSEIVRMSDFEPRVLEIASVGSITIGQQAGTTDTLYARWTWNPQPADSTELYNYEWQYKTANNVWFEGQSGTATLNNCTYQMPSNATDARVRVQPVAKTYTLNTKDYEYWTTKFSSWASFSASALLPKVPSVPTVTMNGLKLTASVDVYDSTATEIEFQVVADNTKIYKSSVSAKVVTNHASATITVAVGSEYKVKARGVSSSGTSEWSEFSASVGTVPKAIGAITKKTALSSTSIRIDWAAVTGADEYKIEYATNKNYFDSSSEVKSLTVTTPYAILTGLDTGVTWYMRARASNDNGDSAWSKIVSLVLGKTPSAPTTWSETTTATVGSDVILYWVHNSEDDSRQTQAKIELKIGGQTRTVTIDMASDEDTEVDQISSYTFHTSGYSEGASLTWRVKTRGIMPDFSEWSIERVVDIYAVPSLMMSLSDASGTVFETLTALPMTVSLEAGPATQNVIGYSVSIVANESYESVDDMGADIYILQGTQVYSHYFAADTENTNVLVRNITAGDVMLENGVYYTVHCVASFNSGLVAEADHEVLIEWDEDEATYDFYPDAEIAIDEENIVAYIRPYCTNDDEELVENITMAVYRREFDGKLVEIMTGIPNDQSTTIMDPHPALDYARYRIIGQSNTTGRVFYYDTPGIETGIDAIVLQWGDSVRTAEDDDGYFEMPPFAGSTLRLPYNVDVQDSYAPDVSLVKYIGRNHPVSYYGTQLGSTSEWHAEVPTDDEETIYALRCLAVYMGDVYVREPSGSGYWAQINVSMDHTHNTRLVPVSLSITRVEGGA